MPQTWKVSKAFQSTNKETGAPEVIQTKGGDSHKFMVQVEGQPVSGWFSVLKKPGNKVDVGDELYGDIVENNWGKPQFNRAQQPFGSAPASPSSSASSDGVTLRMVYDELKYVRSLLENRNVTPSAATSPEVDDDRPVDLSKIPY